MAKGILNFLHGVVKGKQELLRWVGVPHCMLSPSLLGRGIPPGRPRNESLCCPSRLSSRLYSCKEALSQGTPSDRLDKEMGQEGDVIKKNFFYIEVWMEEPGRLQSMGSLRVGHD